MSATGWTGVLGLDARSLAAWRVGLGGIVLYDALDRMQDAVTHYSDAGLVPRSMVPMQRTHPSILYVTGEPWAGALVLGLLALAGLALLLGWRTRIATFAAWFLLLNVQARNPFLLYGGDVLLRMMLFWAMFLPTDSVASVEAARGRRPLLPPVTVLSVGSVAYVMQIALLYFVAGVLKDGKPWYDGSAVYYALHIDQLVKPLGTWIAGQAPLYRWLTWWTLAVEILGPLLLFVPWRFGPFRAVVVAHFVALHVGLWLTMDLGLFPQLSLICWLPLVPGWLWDRLRWPMVEGVSLPWAWWTWAWQGVGAVALLLVVYWNLGILAPDALGPRPWYVRRVAHAVRLDQYWDMFAPRPLVDDNWFVIAARTGDGRVLDLFQHAQPRTWKKPADLRDLFPAERWRKYMDEITLPEERTAMRERFLLWHCARWNATHHGPDHVDQITLYRVVEETPPPGRPWPPLRRIRLAQVVCPQGAPAADVPAG